MEKVSIEQHAYIECLRGALGHAWTVDGWYMGTDGRMRRRDHCMRCPVTRTNVIEGWVTKRSYQYPDDYHLDHRPSGPEVTEEFRNRTKKVYNSELSLERSLRRNSGNGKDSITGARTQHGTGWSWMR